MNPDRVIGTAVLVETPDHHWLCYLKVGRNLPGPSWDMLPMLPADAPACAAPLPSWFPENNPWRYRLEGGQIQVEPSINIGDGWWHNDRTWSVRVVRAPAPVASPGLRDWRGPAYVAILDQLVAVNSAADTERLREALPRMRETE